MEWTILRPGRLTDEAGTGKVLAGKRLENRTGEIRREDVAAAVAACFEMPDETVGRVIELFKTNGKPSGVATLNHRLMALMPSASK